MSSTLDRLIRERRRPFLYLPATQGAISYLQVFVDQESEVVVITGLAEMDDGEILDLLLAAGELAAKLEELGYTVRM